MNMTQQEPITVFSAAAQRLWIAEQADRCVKWLKAQGMEVLRVERGHTAPRIHIKPGPLCDRFADVVQGYERGPQGERRYKMVWRWDCEVRWSDGGAT